MQSFDILNRHTPIPRAFLLEASAGTGKTFAIEHLVVRYVIAQDPLAIDTFCIVTFTKKATSELKVRLREALLGAKKQLEEKKAHFDYLAFIIEQGSSCIEIAKSLITRALDKLHTTHIFTIHGFCLTTLKENLLEAEVSIESLCEEGLVTKRFIQESIIDFFRTDHCAMHLTPAQRKVLLKEYAGNFEALIDALVETCSLARLSFEKKTPMQTLDVSSLHISHTEVENMLLELVNYFKDAKTRAGTIKEPLATSIEAVVNIFKKEVSFQDIEKVIEEGLYLFTIFNKNNLKAQASEKILPRFLEDLKNILDPLAAFPCLYIRLAACCFSFVEERKKERGLLSFDALIMHFHAALKKDAFLMAIKNRYEIALIDEFQDTDALQWDLFKTLFLDRRLILVGDPKQAIYRFRQADIYTYLEAKKDIGEQFCYSLSTNWRSTSLLVDAFNMFFSLGKLFPLPRTDTFLEYHFVACGNKKVLCNYDPYKAIHFFQSEVEGTLEEQEKKFLFPWMVEEIKRLHLLEKKPLHTIAILVADRFQARRVKSALQEGHIPAIVSSNASFDLEAALSLLQELVQALMYPKNLYYIKQLLLGPLLQYEVEQVISFNPLKEHSFYKELSSLREEFFHEGFGKMFYSLLHGPLHVMEKLFALEGGDNLYARLLTMTDLISSFEQNVNATPLMVLDFIKEKQKSLEGLDKEKEGVDKKQGVQIMTIHASKGLEFSFVFGLGLVRKSPQEKKICVVQEGEALCLKAVTDEEDPFFIEQKKELMAERGRLLYVAITRAKERFYCPLLKTKNLREEIAIEGYLSTIDEPFVSWTQKEFFSVSRSLEGQRDYKEEKQAIKKLKEPLAIELKFKNLYMHSFSSLHKKIPIKKLLESSLDTLPQGKMIGNLLHSLLENVSLDLLKHSTSPQALIPFIEKELMKTSFEDTLKEPLSLMVYTAFKTPLIDQSCLLDAEHILREAPFLSEKSSQTMVTGVMDCVFQCKEKIYLVDFKSTWLEEYTQEKLHQCMLDHHYYEQAELYKNALKNYLKNIDTTPFEERFGGIFYLFLRGMHVEKKTGILHFFEKESFACQK
jgi:exodeoxyribonuclease V beta subunit